MTNQEIEKTLRRMVGSEPFPHNRETLFAAADIVAKYSSMGVGNQSYADIASDCDRWRNNADNLTLERDSLRAKVAAESQSKFRVIGECADLLEKVSALEHRIGICPTCKKEYVHDCDEPFAHCDCGQGEWAFTDVEKEPLAIQAQYLKAKVSALEESEAETRQWKHAAESWQQKATEWSRENAELRATLSDMRDLIKAMNFGESFPRIVSVLKDADYILSNVASDLSPANGSVRINPNMERPGIRSSGLVRHLFFMAYYNYKELRDELPAAMLDKWSEEDGSADCNSTLWLHGAEYIRQLKEENARMLAVIAEAQKIAASVCCDPKCKCSASRILTILSNAQDEGSLAGKERES